MSASPRIPEREVRSPKEAQDLRPACSEATVRRHGPFPRSLSEPLIAKRLAKSFGALAAGQALNVIGQILLVPLFLSHWSTTPMASGWLSPVVAYLNATDWDGRSRRQQDACGSTQEMTSAHIVLSKTHAIAFYVILAAVITAILGLVCALCPSHPGWD